jgi:FMN phosphatase YigB (HAD superfamily)
LTPSPIPIIISEEVGFSKPDEKIFRIACDRLECPPSECFFIGDSWEIDILGSYKAEMKPVWFNRYKKGIPENIDDLLVIQELKDLEDIIRKAESEKCSPSWAKKMIDKKTRPRMKHESK